MFSIARGWLDGWQVGFSKECAEGVLGTDRGWSAVECLERPGDVESGVVPEDGAFSGGVVKVSGLIEDFGGVGEDKEPVGEAFGDPEELEIVTWRLSFQVKSRPSSEVGRVAAEVDGYVPDMAGEDTDEFALRSAELVVQAAENAFYGEGLVVLNEFGGKTR